MNNNLDRTLTMLGIPPQARYPVDTVAQVLGIQRSQVLELLRRDRLRGSRSSERRWAGVWHQDLSNYLNEICRPRGLRQPSPAKSPIPVPTLTPISPASPSISIETDPLSALDGI